MQVDRCAFYYRLGLGLLKEIAKIASGVILSVCPFVRL